MCDVRSLSDQRNFAVYCRSISPVLFIISYCFQGKHIFLKTTKTNKNNYI